MEHLPLNSELAGVLEDQAGVVARRQIIAAGLHDDFIARHLRRRLWARVHPGVYVDHTGPLSHEQRCWAAVLFYWPAALCHQSATNSAPTTEQLVHVAIEHPRKAIRLPGVQLHRLRNLHSRVLWNLHPPRLRLEDALLDVCADASTRVQALAVVTDACQSRRTTAARLLEALNDRKRLRFGRWLRIVLADVASGAQSVLEHAYLRKVERAHGLPSGRRQLASRLVHGVVYRDVAYSAYALVVELDGRIGHEKMRDRARDNDRDLDTAIEGVLTLRIGWSQVEDRPCRTAQRIAMVLASRGWAGQARACGPGCPIPAELPQRGRSSATGAGKRPH